jgi:hypothetical protein
LRSPSGASGELLSGATCRLEAKPGGGEVATAATAPFVSGAPHLPQKSDVGGVSALHFAQCFTSAFPHFAQKLLVEGLFVPHFEQGIALPGNQATRTSCIIRCREGAAGRGKANWTPLRLLLREERPRRAVPLRRCELEFCASQWDSLFPGPENPWRPRLRRVGNF